MADFLRCLGAVWCFELGALFTWAAKSLFDESEVGPGIAGWIFGSVFMALGWWLA